MVNHAARIEQVRRDGLKGRLVKGAQILGRLWREGVKCEASWSMKCPCGEGATAFCEAKIKWIGVLSDHHDGVWPYGLEGTEPFFVIDAMSRSMFDASGLTMKIDAPLSCQIKIGPKGVDWSAIRDLTAMLDAPDFQEAIEAVVAIQTVLA